MKQLSTIIFILFSLSGMAQQNAHYTFFMLNQQYLNPAFVGSRNTGSFTGLHRSQWIGFEGAPTSQLLSFQTPIMKSRAGIGGLISRNSIGVTNSYIASAAYSYNVRLTQKLDLRVGVQATLEYYGINFADESVVVQSQGDPSLNEGDFASAYAPNVGIGMFLKYEDLFYFGASSPQIYPNEIGFNDLSTLTAQVDWHRYIMAGGALPLSDQFELMPNILVKWVDDAPLSIDANLSLRYAKKVTAGFTYRSGTSRTSDSIDAMLFFQFGKKIGAGLAYDLTLSKIRDYQSGSVELIVRYDLRDEKTDLTNPRYFKKK